jgi:hypothetical protein
MPPLPLDPVAVFLNIPYDEEFRNLYIAYIVGLYQLGFTPHLSSEMPGGARRLDRILDLIQSCRYSIHDLSRVELSSAPGSAPRFNMPLELGMTITWQILNPNLHTWFVCESEPHRLQRSASDLNGSDPNIHFGTPEGVLSEVRSAFWREGAPSVRRMMEHYRFIDANVDAILDRNGTSNLFSLAVFKELCWLCSGLSSLLKQTPRN